MLYFSFLFFSLLFFSFLFFSFLFLFPFLFYSIIRRRKQNEDPDDDVFWVAEPSSRQRRLVWACAGCWVGNLNLNVVSGSTALHAHLWPKVLCNTYLLCCVIAVNCAETYGFNRSCEPCHSPEMWVWNIVPFELSRLSVRYQWRVFLVCRTWILTVWQFSCKGKDSAIKPCSRVDRR